MEKFKGIHFYVCITNYNQIIHDEEKRTKKLTHSVHMLDTFFSSIERYGKSLSESLVVEKITGARLHLFVSQEKNDDINSVYGVVKKVVYYSYRLTELINREIGKYKTIEDITINIGAAYGKFYDFEFSTDDGYTEYSTIGYAPNYAAKLQALSASNHFSISDDIYQSLLDDRYLFIEKRDPLIRKYDQDRYYTVQIRKLVPDTELIPTEEINRIHEYANRLNLSEMVFDELSGTLDFSKLSSKKCKALYGIPFFADVRGFTTKFDSDDANLNEMAKLVRDLLLTMYYTVKENEGVHIQCQGDREFAVFCDARKDTDKNKGFSCFKKAVLAAMRLVDKMKYFDVHIGIGESYGKMFATKIGARGEKDNILVGDTVAVADMMEDKNASEDQIAITPEVYDGLKNEDNILAGLFHKRGEYYVTNSGYNDFQIASSRDFLNRNNVQHNYNGAWGKM